MEEPEEVFVADLRRGLRWHRMHRTVTYCGKSLRFDGRKVKLTEARAAGMTECRSCGNSASARVTYGQVSQ